jgi:hypothetical protein
MTRGPSNRELGTLAICRTASRTRSAGRARSLVDVKTDNSPRGAPARRSSFSTLRRTRRYSSKPTSTVQPRPCWSLVCAVSATPPRQCCSSAITQESRTQRSICRGTLPTSRANPDGGAGRPVPARRCLEGSTRWHRPTPRFRHPEEPRLTPSEPRHLGACPRSGHSTTHTSPARVETPNCGRIPSRALSDYNSAAIFLASFSSKARRVSVRTLPRPPAASASLATV